MVAVSLPKDFRFEGTEVEIEKHGEEVVLRPRQKPRLHSLADVARFMRENFPEARDFPGHDLSISGDCLSLPEDDARDTKNEEDRPA